MPNPVFKFDDGWDVIASLPKFLPVTEDKKLEMESSKES
jgi:hypothetical protein